MIDNPPAIIHEVSPPKIPRVAAGLTLLVPLGVVAGAGAGLYPFTYWLAPAAALGLGSGHIYAGDPVRGVLIGAGAPVVILGSGAIFGGAAYSLNLFPNYDRNSMGIAASLIGVIAATAAYTGWASVDAYQTTERVNREASPSHDEAEPVRPRGPSAR